MDNSSWRKPFISSCLLHSLIVFLLLSVPFPESTLTAKPPQRTKRILMLFSESKFVLANVIIEEAARNALIQGKGSFEFYAEYLDANRFPEENHYRLFREYLQAKYAQRPPDLVMPFLARNFELAGQLPAELFPKTPVIFAALTEADIPSPRLGANVTGVVERMDVSGALGIILAVQPDTQRIIVVGGTAPLDRLYLSLAEKAAQPLRERTQIEFWTSRPVSDIQQAVKTLPPRTVVFLTTVFRDAAGETFYPEQVAALLAAASIVPVYVLGDPMVGTGVVGGKVAYFEGLGKRVGELALRVLDGAAPDSLPVEVRSEGVPMFDWRALKRWGISESRLPQGTIVRFRAPNIWEQYRWYLLGALVVLAAQAAMIAGLLVQRTRRRRAEAEVLRHRDELAHLTRVAAVGELTATVAHELNQPLGAILSNAEAAEMFLKTEPPALDEVREILADIRHDDQRASQVIRRMRSLMRKQELAPQAIDVAAAVQDVLKLLSGSTNARNGAIRCERMTGVPPIWCDPVQFQQIILNLVLNGVDAMAGMPQDHRQMTVRAAESGKRMVQIAVSDSGPGIASEALPKLFEPFFTTKKEGMGMGLSIARTIVEAHHGQIWAENNTDRGATFYFTLPIAEKTAA
jgi:signal transduction histidine kinase